MRFLLPAGFWWLILAIPILLLYMLKLRRKQVQVSSTLLWTKLLRDQQANAPWQKLKRNLLLILQLLILAALVLALARPVTLTRAVASGSVIVLLDASASMNATDVSPSRFEVAQRTVQTLVNELSSDSRVTLIRVGQTAETLINAETDKSFVRNALAKAQPTQGSADWQAAFALAAGAAHGSQDVTVVIVSDGGLPESGLPALPGEVRYVPIGESNDNLAITALALRASAGGPELFAEVKNYADKDRSVLLSIYFGNSLVTARRLDLAAGTSQSLNLDHLPNTAGVYKARISDPQNNSALDSLSLDDTAFAIYQASSARRILLVSKGNLFLEQLLASLPGIQPFRALSGEDGTLQIPVDPFDLYILDGAIPPQLPAGNLLFVHPSSNPLFEVGVPFKDMSSMQVSESPLTRYVDWSNVHILQANSVQLPDWADVLIESQGGPLVFAGETNGHRVAALTFDLRQSDLPLQVAYPILFANLINYLVPPSTFDATQSLQPGGSLAIAPPADTNQVVVVSPSGKAYNLSPSEHGLVFTETDELGYYAVNFISGASTAAGYFAVNLFNDSESDIHPRSTVQVGRVAVPANASDQVGQREVWTWLAALALLVLLIEWQVYHRRSFPSPMNWRGERG